jgi:superfamily II DNA or RNA helicase
MPIDIEIKPNIVQSQALAALKEHDGNKALIVLPSGVGKTVFAAMHIKEAKIESMLYIVHRREILDQAIDEFKRVHHDISNTNSDIGIFTGRGKKEVGKRFTFATIQTISRQKNLDKLSKHHFGCVIVDEYHHIGAETYMRTLDSLNFSTMIGMTATPFRYDGKNVLQYVNNALVFQIDLKQGIESKVLVPFSYNGFYDDIDYSKIKWMGYKYREKDLNKTLLIEKRDRQIINEFKKYIDNDQTVGFCCSVEHVNRMVNLFNRHGLPAAGITHKTQFANRFSILDDFRNQRIQVLFTRDILNEGVDFPFVKGLLFLRPTFSKTVFLQQLGRGLRTAPGKDEVMVLDFIGNYHHSFRLREWIGFAETSEEPIMKRERKPVYEYLPKAKVHFDKKVIDIFERQLHVIPTRAELLDEYWRLRKELGRNPMSTDFKSNESK